MPTTVTPTPALHATVTAQPTLTAAIVGIPMPGPNEVHIGPTEPTDPDVEFWYKP